MIDIGPQNIPLGGHDRINETNHPPHLSPISKLMYPSSVQVLLRKRIDIGGIPLTTATKSCGFIPSYAFDLTII